MRRSLVALVLVVGVVIVVVGCTPRQSGKPPGNAVPAVTPPMPTPPPVAPPAAATPAERQTYVCPTHADEKSDQPGKCPRCGAEMKPAAAPPAPPKPVAPAPKAPAEPEKTGT